MLPPHAPPARRPAVVAMPLWLETQSDSGFDSSSGSSDSLSSFDDPPTRSPSPSHSEGESGEESDSSVDGEGGVWDERHQSQLIGGGGGGGLSGSWAQPASKDASKTQLQRWRQPLLLLCSALAALLLCIGVYELVLMPSAMRAHSNAPPAAIASTRGEVLQRSAVLVDSEQHARLDALSSEWERRLEAAREQGRASVVCPPLSCAPCPTCDTTASFLAAGAACPPCPQRPASPIGASALHIGLSPRLQFYFAAPPTIAADGAPAFPLRDTGRYLAVQAHEQFDAQRQELMFGALLARALNRTLVLPRSEGALRISDALDLSALSRLVPLIGSGEHESIVRARGQSGASTREVEFTSHVGDLIYLTRASLESNAAQKAFVDSMGSQLTPRFILDELDGVTSMRDATTLAHRSKVPLFPRANLALPDKVWRRWQDQLRLHLHFKLDVWQRAGLVLDALDAAQSASAARPLDQPFGPGGNRFVSLHWLQRSLEPDSNLHRWSVEEVSERLLEWKLPPGSVVYIATDEPHSTQTRELIDTLQAPPFLLRVFTFQHFADLFPSVADSSSVSGSLQPLVEQLILAHSAQFLPTPRSAASDFVLDLRRWMGAHDAEQNEREFDARAKFWASPLLGKRPPTPDAQGGFL